MTIDDLKSIGFEPIPNFTVMNSHFYRLGRHRHLSVCDVGGKSEMMFICETSDQDERIVSELICLHNYDYDGELSADKVVSLINAILKNK